MMRRALVLLSIALPLAADTTVEQSHKNIKVLQGTPTSQLIPTMAFMANSLGVTCAHCHGAAWESDEKPAKDAARRMIALQRDLNARYYDGKPVVTCNSCHRGGVQTVAIPNVADAGWNRSASPPPAAQGIPAEEAVQRLAKTTGVTHRVVRGTVERFNGRSEPARAPFALTLDGESVKYDTTLSHPPEATRALAVYMLAPPSPERVKGERWTFDGGGALLRRVRETPTPLGLLPEQIDYAGVRDGLPYLARWSRADYRVTYTVEEIAPVAAPAPARPHLQLLRSVPESQLFLVMNAIGDSLGVHCDHCHVKDGDKWLWDSDAKPAKAVGRDMIRMTLAMNAANFEGRTAVTCYTCHHGSLRAARMPPLPPHSYASDPPPRPLPSAAAIVERYRDAIHAARNAAAPVMTLKGTAERSERAGPFEITIADGKMHITAAGQSQTLDGDRARDIAELFLPMKVAGDPARMRVTAVVPIDGRDAYEVESGNRRYYFDVESGLLVRRIIIAESFLGPLPDQADFGDYRAVGGILFPFLIRTSDLASYDTATRHFSEIHYGGG